MFKSYAVEGNFSDVRLAALEALVDFTAGLLFAYVDCRLHCVYILAKIFLLTEYSVTSSYVIHCQFLFNCCVFLLSLPEVNDCHSRSMCCESLTAPVLNVNDFLSLISMQHMQACLFYNIRLSSLPKPSFGKTISCVQNVAKI